MALTARKQAALRSLEQIFSRKLSHALAEVNLGWQGTASARCRTRDRRPSVTHGEASLRRVLREYGVPVTRVEAPAQPLHRREANLALVTHNKGPPS